MHRLPVASLRPLSLAIALALFTPAIQAAEQYRLESGPLSTQLNRFAAQAGIFLVSDGSLTEGHNSRALEGNYSVEQALAVLLEGSGLEAVKTGEKRYEVRPRASSEGLELSAVSISGKAPGSITEGTGSYTTGSTSSSTRLNLAPKETPQSISVLTRQRMDDQRIENVIDALDATAGITVRDFNIGAESPTITARGATMNNFQIDGIQTSSSLSTFLQSTAIFDRVEVVRGATGMMSGLGTPSATINMIRKRPTFGPQAELSVEAGSWARYGTQVDVSGPLNTTETVRGRFVADYKRLPSWTNNYEQDYLVLYGINEFDLNDDTLLTAGFSHTTRDTNSPSRSFPLFYSNGTKTHFNPSDNDSPGWLFNDNEVNNAFVSLEHHFSPNWSGKFEFGHTEYRYESMATTLVAAGLVDQASGNGAYIRPVHWATDARENTLDAYITGTYPLFNREHEIIVGTTLSHVESTGPTYTLTSTYSVPDIWSWADNTPKPDFDKTGQFSLEEHQIGFYLSNRLHLTDSTQLLLGARVTDWKRDTESRTTSTTRTVKTHGQENGVFIPYVGIVHALNDRWSVYSSYTQIFNPQSDRVRDIDNQPLPPEEGTSYEAGVKASLNDGRLSASFGVFRTEQENLAVWQGSGLGYRAQSIANTEGIELELSGQLLDDWNFSGSYAYSVTTNDDNERILPQIPRHTIRSFTSYRLPGNLRKMTIGGGLNWESKSGYAPDIYMQDSFFLANLFARYDLSQHLSTSINLNNAFNKKYFIGVWDDGTYGPPRNVMASLKYTY